MALKKKMGWFKESQRHYLAAKGVKTSYMKRKGVGLGFGAENKDAPVESQKVELKRKPDFFVTPEGLVGGIGSTADPNKTLNPALEAAITKGQRIALLESRKEGKGPSEEHLKVGSMDVAPKAIERTSASNEKLVAFAQDSFGGKTPLDAAAVEIHVGNILREDPAQAEEYKTTYATYRDALAKELAAKETLTGLVLPTSMDDVAAYNETKREATEALKEAKRERLTALAVLQNMSTPSEEDQLNAQRLIESRARKQAQGRVEAARAMQTTPEASLKRQLDEEIERANKQLNK